MATQTTTYTSGQPVAPMGVAPAGGGSNVTVVNNDRGGGAKWAGVFWGPNRGVICGSMVFAVIATVLFVIALTTPYWLSGSGGQGQGASEHRGLFRQCGGSDERGSECHDYGVSDCTLSPNDGSCGEFHAMKALAISATVTAGVAAILLIMMLAAAAAPGGDHAYPTWGPGLGMLAVACIIVSVLSGIAATAVYIAIADTKIRNDGYSYDYSFGLFIGGWSVMTLLSLAACICGAFSQPSAAAGAAAY